jgi:hypothetical protein
MATSLNARDRFFDRGRAIEIGIRQTGDDIDDIGIRVIAARLLDELFARSRVSRTVERFLNVSGIRLAGMSVVL